MSKTKVSGFYHDYVEMFKDIMNWDSYEVESKYYKNGTHKVLGNKRGHYLESVGYGISDLGYHGYDKDAIKNEREIYEKVETAYLYLLKSLAEAIDFKYEEEDSVWKYHLKNIDTNDILRGK